jgi:nitrate/nitrite transport system substrate-binding protein
VSRALEKHELTIGITPLTDSAAIVTAQALLWLASAGIAPDRDVRLRVVPPPRMVVELEAGTIDGFCVDAPWSSLVVLRGSGAIALAKHDVWNNAPEKVLGVRLAWAERYPETHRALLRRLPEFHSLHRFAASFPWRSHASWILTQMPRWGQLEKAIDVRATAAAVYWTELHREAAAEVGIARPDIDEKPEGEHAAPWTLASREGPLELGADLLLDGSRFDAHDCVEHLRRCRLHALCVPLDELAAAQHPLPDRRA